MKRIAYDNGFIGILDGIFKCIYGYIKMIYYGAKKD